MTNPKRYNLAQDTLMGVVEHPEGEFVYYKDVERLREALQSIADDARYLMYDTGDCTFKALSENRKIARKALSGEQRSDEPKADGRTIHEKARDAIAEVVRNEKELTRAHYARVSLDAMIEAMRGTPASPLKSSDG